MKKIFIIGIIAGLTGFSGMIHAQTMTNTNTNTNSMMESNMMGNCAVCGMKMDMKTKYKTVYKGKEYHFCNAACEKEFKKNPDKYIKKMEEMEKDKSSTQ